MYKNIELDMYLGLNYNFGFLMNNSDIIIHLLHWQYWWWFWFLFIFVLYYILIIRLISYRYLKFNPKIVTSYRSHGKWGDLIVCLLPVSWCLNILSNSTLLLRLVEWQSESNLFVLRVRGKQWYWVYKLDLTSLTRNTYDTTMSYQIGHNYYLKLNRINNEFFYYMSFLNYHSIKSLIKGSHVFWQNNLYNISNFENNFNTDMGYSQLNFDSKKINNISNEYSFNYQYTNPKQFKKFNYTKTINILNNINSNTKLSDLSVSRSYRDNVSNYNNLIIKKVSNYNFDNNDLFKLYSKNNNFKKFQGNYYGVIKQNRNDDWLKEVDFFNNNSFINNMGVQDLVHYQGGNYINYWNNMRLLKVNRILTLPTNFNITLITNSFDVVHSWFIPGLGIKMDCVPGRSTHHTLYIDSQGMYYGQCAEICGRFHHHMPIRVCALIYENFLLWWFHTANNLLVSDSIKSNKLNLKYLNNKC